MSGIEFTIDGADELATALTQAPADVAVSLFPVLDAQAAALRDEWRDNARATAGRHGRHYPASITYELFRGADVISADVGPVASRRQGSMGRGFEYGSANQPPHMDGARAAASRTKPFVEAVENEIDQIIARVLG